MSRLGGVLRGGFGRAGEWTTSAGTWLTARRKIEGRDSLAIQCRGLRSDADALIKEYGRAETTDQRRTEILGELQNLSGDWQAIGCQAAFGDIFRELVRARPRRDAVLEDIRSALEQRQR